MKQLLNRLVVTQTDEETDSAENTADPEEAESVEWADLSTADESPADNHTETATPRPNQGDTVGSSHRS